MPQNETNEVNVPTVPNLDSTNAVAASVQTYCRNVVEVIKRLANQVSNMATGQAVSTNDIIFDINQANADVLTLLNQLPPVDSNPESGSAS